MCVEQRRNFSCRLMAFGSFVALAVPLSGFGGQMESVDENWAQRDVGALITKEELGLFETLDSDFERATFRDIFWARRDPNVDTIENEFREEYESYVELADQRFRGRGMPGSRTDQGQIFLLLGIPAKAGSGRELVGLATGASPQETLASSATELVPAGQLGAFETDPGAGGAQRIQRWVYDPDEARGLPDGLEVRFRAQPGYGYRLIETEELSAVLESRRQSRVVNDFIDYETDAAGNLLPPADAFVAGSRAAMFLNEMRATRQDLDGIGFTLTAEFFRSDAGEVYMPVLFEVAPEALSWTDDLAALTVFGAVENQAGEVVFELEEPTQLLRSSGGRVEVPLQLPPGSYTAFLGFVDDTSEQSGGRVLSVNVPSFEGTGLYLSSVLLYDGTEDAAGQAGVPGHAFQFGNTKFHPKGSASFKTTESLGLFYFVYFDAQAGVTEPKLSSRYRFLRDGQEIGQTRPSPLPATADQALGTAEIPLASFPPGSYQLVVEVTHEGSGETIEKRVRFNLEP